MTRVEFEGEANGKAREVFEVHGRKVALDGTFNFGSSATRPSRASLCRKALCLYQGLRSADTFAIYIFQQGDGTWDVFPPDEVRRVMTVI